MRAAIILPACNEAECLPLVLEELLPVARELGCVVAVGLNDTSDASAEILAAYPSVLVGHTPVRGYGQGCVAAMQAVSAAGLKPDCYLFLSADGAHDPAALPAFLACFSEGADLVLGQRTLLAKNWRHMGALRIITNLMLGLWAALHSGCFYEDLGPYRLVSARFIRHWEQLPRDLRWGWTIEPQVLAPALGMVVRRVSVLERPRVAGQQKVTGVSLRQSLRIGKAILRAGAAMQSAQEEYATGTSMLEG